MDGSVTMASILTRGKRKPTRDFRNLPSAPPSPAVSEINVEVESSPEEAKKVKRYLSIFYESIAKLIFISLSQTEAAGPKKVRRRRPYPEEMQFPVAAEEVCSKWEPFQEKQSWQFRQITRWHCCWGSRGRFGVQFQLELR